MKKKTKLIIKDGELKECETLEDEGIEADNCTLDQLMGFFRDLPLDRLTELISRNRKSLILLTMEDLVAYEVCRYALNKVSVERGGEKISELFYH